MGAAARILNPPQPAPSTKTCAWPSMHGVRQSSPTRHRYMGATSGAGRHPPFSVHTQPGTIFGETVVNEVCVRGYTCMIPWRRYRVTLDPSGVTALQLAEVPLQGSCWEDVGGGRVARTTLESYLNRELQLCSTNYKRKRDILSIISCRDLKQDGLLDYDEYFTLTQRIAEHRDFARLD